MEADQIIGRRRPARWVLGVAGLAVLLMGAVVSINPASADDDDVTILRLFFGEADVEEIDLGTPGPSAGDLLVGTAEGFYNRGQTRKAGFVRFTCVFNLDGVMCTNHVTLTGRGQIVSMQSANPAEGPVAIDAVVGGTGEFSDVSGEARAVFGPAGVDVTLRLHGLGDDD